MIDDKSLIKILYYLYISDASILSQLNWTVRLNCNNNPESQGRKYKN